MQNFKNKKVVITGGNSGIGLAVAKEIIKEGAEVIITGRNETLTNQTAKEIGALGLVSDQSNISEIEALSKFSQTKFQKIDILFVNAGVASFAPIEAVSEKHFDEILDINFKGALFTLQKFIPILNDGASVIFLSSINSYNAMPNTAVYAASKAALNALTKVAAIELAPRGIRVNAVCPGPVNTPLWSKVGMTEEQLAQTGAHIQSKVPLKKFASPEEISKTVLFLASDDSSNTTGAEFVVDGGFNLNPMV